MLDTIARASLSFWASSPNTQEFSKFYCNRVKKYTQKPKWNLLFYSCSSLLSPLCSLAAIIPGILLRLRVSFCAKLFACQGIAIPDWKVNYFLLTCFTKVTTTPVIITAKDEFRSKLTVEHPSNMAGAGLLPMATGFVSLLMVGAVGVGQVKRSPFLSSYYYCCGQLK